MVIRGIADNISFQVVTDFLAYPLTTQRSWTRKASTRRLILHGKNSC